MILGRTGSSSKIWARPSVGQDAGVRSAKSDTSLAMKEGVGMTAIGAWVGKGGNCLAFAPDRVCVASEYVSSGLVIKFEAVRTGRKGGIISVKWAS